MGTCGRGTTPPRCMECCAAAATSRRFMPRAPIAPSEAELRPYLQDLEVITGDSRSKAVVLVRPDGYVAARGRPGDLRQITAYLDDLFGEPEVAGHA